PELSHDKLYNIATGKAASPLVKLFLLNVENIGNEERQQFIAECTTDIRRFEKSISMDHNVDVMKILSYLITPVLLSLCHFDGAICKTNKSVLTKCLETGVNHEPP
ncbi:hypothetical protein PV327_011694, partial [Microctonus hyperodae]